MRSTIVERVFAVTSTSASDSAAHREAGAECNRWRANPYRGSQRNRLRLARLVSSRLLPAAPAAGDQADGDQTETEEDQRSASGSGSGQVRGSVRGGFGSEFGLGGLGVLQMHLRLGGVVGGEGLHLGMRAR